MRTLLIGDLHRNEPFELIAKLRREKEIERVVALGDYDSPEIALGLMSLDIPSVVLPGNHDYPLMVDAVKLNKRIKMDRTKSPGYLPFSLEEYWGKVIEYIENPKLLDFAKKFVEDYENERRFEHLEALKNGANVVHVHASIYDSETINEDVADYYPLWEYMYSFLNTNSRQVVEGNLEEMRNRNLWILFRGHDPCPMLVEQGVDQKDFKKLPITPRVQLERDKRYIFTVGPYQSGNYAIFDDEAMLLEPFSTRMDY